MTVAEYSGATPILDSAILPPKKRSFASLLFGLILGVVFGTILISEMQRATNSNSSADQLIIVFYFAAFTAAIILHELGHLAAGKLIGFRFNSLTIGPFSLYFEYGRLRFRVRRALPAGGYAGMQVHSIRRLRQRLFIFTIGGPAANLLSGGVALAVLASVPSSKSWVHFLTIFWMISLVLGIGNLVPVRLGLLYPDGARLWMLYTSLPKARRWLSICAIGKQTTAGVQPRDYRRTWLNSAGAVVDSSVDDFFGNWVAYLAANDRKDTPAAAHHLERCLRLASQLGPSLQDTIGLEAAVFSAWFRNDAQLASKWRARVKKFNAVPQLMKLRFEISMDCARQDYISALSRWKDGFSFIEKLPPTPIKGKLTKSFLEWRDEIRERECAHSVDTPVAAIGSATR